MMSYPSTTRPPALSSMLSWMKTHVSTRMMFNLNLNMELYLLGEFLSESPKTIGYKTHIP